MSIFNTGKSLIKKVKPIPIFFTINNAFAPYVACSIASIIKHANPKKYYRIVILNDGLSLRNRIKLRSMVTRNCEIQFRKMTHNIYLRTIIHYCSRRSGAGDYFSSAVYYYRAFIARLFPQYSKAIYIDSDTILTGDIAELYDIDLGEKTLAALPAPKVKNIPVFKEYVEKALGISCDEYVNSGVLLMDLKKMRKAHYISTMIDLINKFNADLVAPDQDYLNVIFRGKILHLDETWNYQPISKTIPEHIKLTHFNLFKKPWFYSDIFGGEIFWENAAKTPFYNELVRGKENYSLKDAEKNDQKIAALLKKAENLANSPEPLIKL